VCSCSTFIINDELDRFRLDSMAREFAPLVASLRARAEQLRADELERLASRLGALDQDARDVVEQVTRGLVNKLLHEPTVRLKDAAGSARGELYADALSELFALDEPPGPDTPGGGDTGTT
jgi:glutamyl-tRNA reductase